MMRVRWDVCPECHKGSIGGAKLLSGRGNCMACPAHRLARAWSYAERRAAGLSENKDLGLAVTRAVQEPKDPESWWVRLQSALSLGGEEQ